MKKLFFLLVTSMCMFCFSLPVQAAEEKATEATITKSKLPTIKELETWPYVFYQTMEVKPGTEDPNGPGFTLIQTYVFKAPADHYLNEILVGIARGNDGIIYAFAMGCLSKGETKPVSCNYDWPQE